MLRRRMYKVHKWLGLVMGLVWLAISVTGSLLVFRAQMDATLRPSVFSATPRPRKVSLDSVVHSVMNRYRTATPVALDFARAPGDVIALYLRQDGTALTVLANPYTGEITGERSEQAFTRVLYRFHTALFLGRAGQAITALLALLLVFEVCAGIYVYWPARRGAFQIRRKKHFSIVLADLHHFAGVWTILFLLVISISGFWMNHETLFPEGETHAEASIVPAASLDEALANAHASIMRFSATSLVFPHKATQTFALYGSHRMSPVSFLYGRYATRVNIDAVSAKVVSIVESEHDAVFARLNHLAYPVHAGDYDLEKKEFAAQLIYFVGGLSPALLSLTGLGLWRVRRRGSSMGN